MEEDSERIQGVLDALDDFYEYDENSYKENKEQLNEALGKVSGNFTLDEIIIILEKARCDKVVLNNDIVSTILDKCEPVSLDTKSVKDLLKRCGNLTDNTVSKILTRLSGSLDTDAVEDLLERCGIFNTETADLFLKKCADRSLSEKAVEYLLEDYEGLPNYDLLCQKCKNDDAKKIVKEHQIKKTMQQNKNLGIGSSIGLTFGILLGLGAIGLGVAIGIGALTVTMVLPIVFAVVGFGFMFLSSLFLDKSRVNKALNKIELAELKVGVVNEDEISFDILNRESVKVALNDLNKSISQNDENEVIPLYNKFDFS